MIRRASRAASRKDEGTTAIEFSLVLPVIVTTVARWRHCARTAAPLQSKGRRARRGAKYEAAVLTESFM